MGRLPPHGRLRRCQRSAPVGNAAYGIPRYSPHPLLDMPHTTPLRVCTGMAQLESASRNPLQHDEIRA
jgi:hypothetical protein